MKLRSNFGFLFFLITFNSFGQEPIPDSSKFVDSFDDKVQLTILPVIGSNPSTGFLVGAAATLAWRKGPAHNTHLSSAQASALLTSKNQKIFTFKSNQFSKNDEWDLIGDWRLLITSAPTYGLGTGPQSAKPVGQNYEYSAGMFNAPIPDDQMMLFNYLRLHEIFLKKVKKYFYVGAGYHFDHHFNIDDKKLNLDTSNGNVEQLTSHYAYSIKYGFNPNKYLLSGVSIGALYDSRDNAINPYSGQYAMVSYRVNTTFLGSDQNSSILWLEYRNYFPLNKERPRHMIALWTFGNFLTTGNIPYTYMDLPAIGWDQFGRSGRAYVQGRLRGKNLMYGELEYRFPLQKDKETWGGVLFVNATTASSFTGIGLFDYIDPAAGVGIRFMVKKDSRVNITADYAVGKYGENGFFFNINEVF